tara:strand:+ start:251320 stop:251733 length:414 start_codon:yes stop_codon:yes gene_type:complete
MLALLSLNSFSSEVLLQYVYGNSKSASELTVLSNGVVELKEGESAFKVDELDSDQIRDLREKLYFSRFGPFLHLRTRTDLRSYGQVVGKVESQEVILKEKLKDEIWLIENESLASKEIMKFLNSFDPQHKWRSVTKE